MIRLMIKTHCITGFRYLCKTTRLDWQDYKGSGTLWRKHLRKHGASFTTELLFECEDPVEFRSVALEWSKKLNVVDDPSWANLCHEEGSGGGTALGKRWINNGKCDRMLDASISIPNGWVAGRLKCVFNDPVKQQTFSSKANIEKRGASIKKAWDNRDKNLFSSRKTGLVGDANPAKRDDVRAKMRSSASKSAPWACPSCGIVLKRRGLHGVKTPCKNL